MFGTAHSSLIHSTFHHLPSLANITNCIQHSQRGPGFLLCIFCPNLSLPCLITGLTHHTSCTFPFSVKTPSLPWQKGNIQQQHFQNSKKTIVLPLSKSDLCTFPKKQSKTSKSQPCLATKQPPTAGLLVFSSVILKTHLTSIKHTAYNSLPKRWILLWHLEKSVTTQKNKTMPRATKPS